MNPKDYAAEVVWIIGASSGIGLSLAHELARRGARLAVSARRSDELEKLCVTLGEGHRAFACDVADSQQILLTAQAVASAFGRIDRVIFLSASYTPMRLDELDLVQCRLMIEVNLLGALHVVHAVLPIFKAQHKGQIALCGSVAGYFGLPGGQPYSATKAALQNLAESLHSECSSMGIDVRLISPGFVHTALTTKNNFTMPMIITPEKAAAHIADGLVRSTGFDINFPKRFTLVIKLLRLLPYRVAFFITSRI